MTHILAIDQGTTSSRAILFDASLRPVAAAQEEFPQHYPRPGWVEHDPADLWSTVAGTARAAIEKAGIKADEIAAIGITNQRETTLIWDRATGQPIHPAVVWQDRRTADTCAALKAAGHEPMITERTGLLLDPYFSGTKVKWLLDHVEGAREREQRGELAFGTVDTWLIWNLTGGKVHATDATNASRTLIYNIARGKWDADICALLDIPLSLLPEVRDCAAPFGMTRPDRGRILLNGEGLQLRSNRDAVAQGIAYVSEDRLALGLIQPQSIADNAVLSVLKRISGAGGLLSAQKKEATVSHWLRELAVKIGLPEDPVSTLSGGNQQRVVLAKWLATEPKVLLLDCPTVGVDVGARAGIFRIVRQLADRGLAILLVSDEVPEVFLNADRVLHMAGGRIIHQWDPRQTRLQDMEAAVYA